MRDIELSNEAKAHTYKGIPLRWDKERVMDEPFGEDFIKTQGKTSYKEPETMITDERIVHLAERILIESIEENASDIQVWPQKDRTLIRLRLDNRMEPIRQVHRGAHEALIAVFQNLGKKALGNFARPSIDGHITFDYLGRQYDFRMAQTPTDLNLPMLTMRLLKSEDLNPDLGALGLPERIVHTYRRLMKQKEGLILLVGGTGSGKSTTLMTGILEVLEAFDYKLNILTIENPVEYYIPDIIQHSTNNMIGEDGAPIFDFTTALQSFLRQNPDQILVGEVNNDETAKTMARAAGTGHLVYSTLHANSVLEVHDALRAYSLSERDIAQTLRLAVYQSLEPKLCDQCKRPAVVTVEEKRWLDRHLLSNSQMATVYEPNLNGCEQCVAGHRGRVILGEMLEANREYRLAFEQAQHDDVGKDVLKSRLLETEGVNFYPIEFDVERRLKEGVIGLDTAYKLIAG